MEARSNDQWLRDLRSDGSAQTHALEELRRYLLHALPGALKRHGSVPQSLLEDVVQDALLRTLAHLDRFEGRSRFTTWATTIAVRTAMTELRRRRWRDVSLEELSGGDAFSPDAYVEAEASPESQTAQRRVIQAMRGVIDRELSERQRTALLAEMRGMPQEEIGRHLGIGRNAVYKLGHDARKKLKRGLEAAGFSAGEIRDVFSQGR